MDWNFVCYRCVVGMVMFYFIFVVCIVIGVDEDVFGGKFGFIFGLDFRW